MHIIGRHRGTSDQHLTIDDESRTQHVAVFGATGTGKSWFAKHSFMQDIEAGKGGAYFDFHGQDAPWLLDHIPTERIKDVVYFNPLDRAYPIGYNVFDGIRPPDYSTFTDEIVASQRHVHHKSWGDRMEDIITNATRPLFDLPGESKGTMLGVVRMLNDPAYRKWVVRQCQEPAVRIFWEQEWPAQGKTNQAFFLNSSLNKMRRFQSSPILRAIVGQQRSKLDIAHAISTNKILIFDINKFGMNAVDANALASLLLSRLFYEATRRPMPTVDGVVMPEMVPIFPVVIDEFHSVTSLSTVEALTALRKTKLCLTLLDQYTKQLEEEVVNSIFGNVGTKVVFRVGGRDARLMAEEIEGVDRKEYTDLADYQFIAQYKSGQGVRQARGQTEKVTFTRYNHGAAIRSLMQANKAMPRDQFEAQYDRWLSTRHYGDPLKRPNKAVSEGGQRRPGNRVSRGMRSFAEVSGAVRVN